MGARAARDRSWSRSTREHTHYSEFTVTNLRPPFMSSDAIRDGDP